MVTLGILLIVDACSYSDRGRRLVQALTDRWFWILSALMIFDIWRIAS